MIPFKNSKVLFYLLSSIVFGILLNFFYWKTQGAGFVFDMTEWLNDYIQHPGFNYLHPPFDNNLRPVYHLILHNVYKSFGVSYKAWYLLSLGLYFISSSVILVFFDKLYALFNLKQGKAIAFLSALGFVLTPFGTEVAVWYPTIHYLIVFISLFTSLIILIHFKDSLNWAAIPIHILFIISILSIELSYSIVPIVLSTFLLLKYFQMTKESYRSFIIWILSPQILIFIIYNLICAIYYDKFLGHYSIGKVDFSLAYLISHYVKVFFKHVSIINFYGQSFYESTYNYFDMMEYLVIFVFLLAIGYLLWRLSRQKFKLSPKQGIKWYLFICSGFLYIPVSFLFFHNWKEIELDRLGLGMMIFGIALFIFWTFELKNKALKLCLLIYFFGTGCLLLHDYTNRWRDSALVRDKFSSTIPFYKDKNMYVIGAPIVMRYAYLFAINDSAELRRHLAIFQDKNPKGQYQILGFYNMTSIDDIVTVEKRDSLTIHFQLQKWGNWCWHNLKDAIKHVENEKYILVPDEDKLGYTVRFKSLDSNDKLFIFNRLQFREINLDGKPEGYVFL